MFTDLFRPRTAATGHPPADRTPPPTAPDPAFAARDRLIRLRDAIRDAARQPKPRRNRWGEPPVFFFDPARQAEYEAARPRAAGPGPHPVAELVANELPALFRSVEVRQVARAVPGLREAVALLAPAVAAARDLADLLAVPDDETVLILHPAARAGFRLFVRGIADVAQFHLLMLDAVTGDPAAGFLPGPPLPSRFGTACRDADPTTIPAGVPMVAEARYQLFKPSAVRPDGTVPDGFRGCDHWLWGSAPLATTPRVDGERVVVLGETAFKMTWEVERRFPEMAAEAQLLQVLSPFQVAEWLGELAGRPVPAQVAAPERVERLAHAA
ncbi:MAG: hypothetical protein JWO38_5971 [Gemmataceae bacterium]|nr:hypothetical protein [Gemmataceae bacterium]